MQLGKEAFSDLAEAYVAAVIKNAAAAAAAHSQPEDQLKPSVKELIESVGDLLGTNVEATTESYMAELSARPDMAVAVNELVQGHIELKAPGKGANANRLKGHDKEQWKKLEAHPNLIYTDGSEWRHYREGGLVGKAVNLRLDFDSDESPGLSSRDIAGLRDLLLEFLNWEPVVPTTPKALASALAPLCRLLRDEALAVVRTPNTSMAMLAGDWRRFFFGDADDPQFADAYAQTVTYALLLARFEGETELAGDAPSKRLDRKHSLLAHVLVLLRDPRVREEVEMPLDLLERTIAATEPSVLTGRGNADPWLYFYEHFLAEYDPQLRNDRGVYYTPVEVVQAQVRLASELLEQRLGKQLGLVDDGVVVLDPATGTGTYLLGALDHGLERARTEFGDGAVAGRASAAAETFHGFELLVGPYAVAHMRMAQRILAEGGKLPANGIGVYLTDTLESPYIHPQGQQQMTVAHKPLAEENERARKVKRDSRVLVCIGNPPYDRQQIDPEDEATERKGGWVRRGDTDKDVPILDDFSKPVRDAGQGGQLKNLYNDYVYFWRWALWKVFDDSGGPGIVSFITASSYLRGPGFAGMRRVMRETFDEMWIIDLGGDNLGARKSENVFAIRTPVAIAIGVRKGGPDPGTPAAVRYSGELIDEGRAAKLARLAALQGLSGLDWQDCYSGWEQPLLPDGAGDYFGWPLLTDMFPWQISGAQFKRTWPISPDAQCLKDRWRELMRAEPLKRASLFRETRDRAITRSYGSLDSETKLDPIAELNSDSATPQIRAYAYRSFDRVKVMADPRLGDFIRPPLWHAHSGRQVYLTSLLTGVLGSGPAATVTAEIPDLHHFRGSFGAKDAIPLWRDAGATHPNITMGLLKTLSTQLGNPVEPGDLLAYSYAVLAGDSYASRFAAELAIPGPRLPVTKDTELFGQAVELGRRLIWLHTYGERFVPAGEKAGVVPKGTVQCTQEVPAGPDSYPEGFFYDESTKQLRIGTGIFEPVEKAVFEFSVSGLEIVKSWLRYRMRDGAGRKSSPLDDIRPASWPAEYTIELCRLLWIIEHSLSMQDELRELLDKIVEGATFSGDELPIPSDDERKASTVEPETTTQMRL